MNASSIDLTCAECKSKKFKLYINKDNEVEAACFDCGERLFSIALEPEMLMEVLNEELKNIK
jgi:hypothetical protein